MRNPPEEKYAMQKFRNRLLPCALLALLAASTTADASILVGVVTRDGIAMAADSRLNRVTAEGDHQVVADNEPKLVAVRDRFLVAMGGRPRAGLPPKPVWRRVLAVGDACPADIAFDDFVKALVEKLGPLYGEATDEERALTMLVAGYDGGAGRLAEVVLPSGSVRTLHTTLAPGMAWAGDGGVALDRLILGVDRRSLDDETRSGEDRKALRKHEFVFALDQIPLAEAVELAIECVHTCIAWSRFIKGEVEAPEHFHPTVGGPIDAAVVTEAGAQWVQSKERFDFPPANGERQARNGKRLF